MPSRSRFWGPVAAGTLLVAFAVLFAGAQPAQAVDPSPFLLGTGVATPNVSGLVTSLKGSAGTALDIENVSPAGTAIFGVASALTGQSTTGVYGKTNSTGGGSGGVNGVLNTGTPGAGSAGVFGTSLSTTGEGPGVYGQHTSVIGTAPGVLGETSSSAAGATGVAGTALATAGGPGAVGVRGVNNSTNASGIGVVGTQAGSGYGVYGATPAGWGVVGVHSNQTGTQPGVMGQSSSKASFASAVQGQLGSQAGIGAAAVRGDVNSSGPYGIGVWGSQYGQGWGIYGYSPFGVGIVGDSPSGWAGYFFGNVYVTGNLLKGAGGSIIDNPMDPKRKYLAQASVESPDMKNIYDGIATTDARGFAVVKLPAYFQALNKDYRYQLTSLSGLQQVAVSKEVANNRFTIQSERPNSRVSWQVTGIRKDPYANAHRIQPVEEKSAADQGKYLNPGVYGEPRSKAIEAHGQLGGGQAPLPAKKP